MKELDAPSFAPNRHAVAAVVTWLAAMILVTGLRAEALPFTLVVLPDTQCYCDTRHSQSAKKWGGDLRRYFFDQTRWIRQNAEKLNIAFVLHEGDITQTDHPDEWKIAVKAMSMLDGKVPYCLCLGNHDMGYRKTGNSADSYSTAHDRKTLFNKYFPRSKFSKLNQFGGSHEKKNMDNSYWKFEAAGMKFLILALEFKPRDEVLKWASSVTEAHREYRAIVLTHSYLDTQSKLTRSGYSIEGNLGEGIWNKFVSRHSNIFMVLCGHVLGEAYLKSKGVSGNEVHQLLSDYQGLKNGGESWLRYMTFHPGKDLVEVYTYNPALGSFKKGPKSRFSLKYEMLKAARKTTGQ